MRLRVPVSDATLFIGSCLGDQPLEGVATGLQVATSHRETRWLRVAMVNQYLTDQMNEFSPYLGPLLWSTATKLMGDPSNRP